MAYTLEKLCNIGMPIAMTALVQSASEQKTIPYKYIAACIQPKIRGNVASEHIGHVVGCMMDRINEVAPKAPPLNILCVNGVTGLPGGGAHNYIKRYNSKINYKHLNNSKRREVLLPVYDEIFKFKKWALVARRAFNIEIPKKSLIRENGEHEGKAQRLGYGGPAESQEHRRLKEYISVNPRLVSAPKGCKVGRIEKLLKSFDEVDVWFVAPGDQLAVEVKSRRSNESDLKRGIFQCVKYRAVLEAENKTQKIDSVVHSCLVSERSLPLHLQTLARLLNVRICVVAPNKVDDFCPSILASKQVVRA